MDIIRIPLLITALALSACNNDTASDPAEVPEPETSQPETSQPIEVERQETSPQEAGSMDTDSALEPFVAEAKNDLARRLEIDPPEIELAEAQAVTWPNSALGCPESDMMYTQALVPGYRVRLVVQGAAYHYHGARGNSPFYCPHERVSAPVATGESGDVR